MPSPCTGLRSRTGMSLYICLLSGQWQLNEEAGPAGDTQEACVWVSGCVCPHLGGNWTLEYRNSARSWAETVCQHPSGGPAPSRGGHWQLTARAHLKNMAPGVPGVPSAKGSLRKPKSWLSLMCPHTQNGKHMSFHFGEHFQEVLSRVAK